MTETSLLSDGEMKLFSVGGTASSGSDELSSTFLMLVTNLVRKGGSAMIHLLGKFFGVSVDNVDPDQIIDEFNAKLQNPETQQKFLFMIQQLIDTTSPAIREAIQQSVEIFQEALEKFFRAGILAGESAVGSIPVIGEMEEAVLTMLNLGRAIMAGVNAATNTATVGINAAHNIKQGFDQNMQKIQEMQNVSQQPFNTGRPYTGQKGGKKIQGLKKLQTNSLNRISNAVQEFQGTRKRRKLRGTKVRIPKLNTTKSKRFKKTRKN